MRELSAKTQRQQEFITRVNIRRAFTLGLRAISFQNIVLLYVVWRSDLKLCLYEILPYFCRDFCDRKKLKTRFAVLPQAPSITKSCIFCFILSFVVPSVWIILFCVRAFYFLFWHLFPGDLRQRLWSCLKLFHLHYFASEITSVILTSARRKKE